MKWMQVSIYTHEVDIEAIIGCLDRLGLDQLEIVNSAAVVEKELEQLNQFWDYADLDEIMQSAGDTCVRVYLSFDDDGKKQYSALEDAVAQLKTQSYVQNAAAIRLNTIVVDEEDWADQWKQYFKPIPVGKKLLVQPVWEDMADMQGRHAIKMESSAVFGTGQHQSTQLCLENLERYLRPGDTVLDFGCGTGILFIAALKLGAQYAVGVDVDPLSQGVCSTHAQINGITTQQYEVLVGNAVENSRLIGQVAVRQYDVVLANIVANVIMQISPIAKTLLKPGGYYIISGIVENRLNDIYDNFAQNGFSVAAVAQKDGWVSMVAQYA